MTDGYITDRHHLAKITQEVIAAAMDLQEAWLTEDATACFPRAGGGPRITGGSHGSVTETIATGIDPDDPDEVSDRPAVDDSKYRDRDQLGRRIMGLHRSIIALRDDQVPAEPTGLCSCCHDDTATHGTRCWPCARFLQVTGRHCNVDLEGNPTDEIHRERPKVRWCQCPPSCCPQDDDGKTSCTERAEDGRTLSRRCRARKARGHWEQAS